MKALTYHGARDIRYESVEDPSIADDRDVIVKVNKCSICGSDLHIYHGESFSDDVGYCVGHEAVGEVVDTGRSVKQLKMGDKVMISAAVGCGSCRYCLAGIVNKCEFNAGSCYGLSHKLEGSQAEYVRVPAADFNAAVIPEGVTDDQALMMTDAMATAWFGARNAHICPGDVVAVIGLGPIGLMAVESAFVMGASRVFAIDLVEERRALARGLGAETPDPAHAKEAVMEATKGRLADCVVEAVGASATISLAIRLAGKRGKVSVIGVNQDRHFDFDMAVAFVKGVNFNIGTCSVTEEWPALVPLIQAGRLKPERYISHVKPLSEGVDAYAMFDGRQDGALKMVLEV